MLDALVSMPSPDERNAAVSSLPALRDTELVSLSIAARVARLADAAKRGGEIPTAIVLIDLAYRAFDFMAENIS